MKFPLKTFRLHWATFSFLHILKYFLLEKKSKGYVVPFVGFSVIVSLKPSNFFCVLTSLRCVFPFLFLHPLPIWLIGWLVFMFLNFSSTALSLYSLLKGMLSVTSCSSYGLLSKHLILFFFLSLEGCLLLISLIWKRRTKTIWMSYNEIYLLKFFMFCCTTIPVWFCTV